MLGPREIRRYNHTKIFVRENPSINAQSLKNGVQFFALKICSHCWDSNYIPLLSSFQVPLYHPYNPNENFFSSSNSSIRLHIYLRVLSLLLSLPLNHLSPTTLLTSSFLIAEPQQPITPSFYQQLDSGTHCFRTSSLPSHSPNLNLKLDKFTVILFDCVCPLLVTCYWDYSCNKN